MQLAQKLLAGINILGTICFSTAYCQYLLEKEVPTNLAIRFKNASTQKVHALFIYTPDLQNVFKVGGWSKISDIALKSAALFPEEGAVIGKKTKSKDATTTEKKKEEKTNKGKVIKIPKKDVAVAFVNITGNIANYLTNTVLQPDAILASMSKKDYFEQVFPGLIVDSCNSPIKEGQHLSNLRLLKKKGDITLAIYPDDKYGLPDFTAPLFLQDFNYAKYNSATYGPEEGHVYYQYINPKTGAKGPRKEKLFVPMQVGSDGTLHYQSGGKAAKALLDKKEAELGGTIEFE